MSRATVDDILDRIKQLPEKDRLLLDELLARQEDEEWREEAAKARKMARDRGIHRPGDHRSRPSMPYAMANEGLLRHQRHLARRTRRS